MLQEELKTLPAAACDEEALKKNMTESGFDPPQVTAAVDIANFLHGKKEMGALLSEIYEQFPNLNDDPATSIAKLLDQLKTNDWMVKAGVTETRYVHHEFRRPWIIHSYKNLKGRGVWVNANDKNGLGKDAPVGMASPPPIILHEDSSSNDDGTNRKTDAVAVESSAGTAVVDSDLRDVSSPATTSGLVDASSDALPNSVNGSTTSDPAVESSVGRRASARQRRKSGEQSTAAANSTSLKDGNYARVELVVRPWRKPDGNLNRPVLYMMMRSILMYVMSFPGAPFKAVANKLSPTVQPIAVRELLDMLVDVGCVSRLYLKRTITPSLFSVPSSIEERSDETEGSEDAVYEAKVDCVLKLGQILPELGETSFGHTADTLNMFYEKSTKEVESAVDI